jgi:23S rRNA (cytidine1920-2'-O)/16S rRNA (cytidine1409-2'-O)-methyltransferase
LVTVDASFISLKIILPVVKKWLFLLSSFEGGKTKEERGDVVALIKPQFEAGKKDVARGDGVIRDPEIHRQVLLDVLGFAQKEGFHIRGLIKSPLLGPKGNAEFLVWLGQAEAGEGSGEIGLLVEQVLL